MAIKLSGKWETGFALDLHTLKSEYAGDDEQGRPRFNTTRTDIGELVYNLKYQNDADAVSRLVYIVKQTIQGIGSFDFLIPIPPSNKSRPKQPVLLVAKALSSEFKLPLLEDALGKKSSISEIKNIQDRDERIQLLLNAMFFNPGYDLSNKRVLLIDDLYRSGATLEVATDLLYSEAHVGTVCVLTSTKTRSNR